VSASLALLVLLGGNPAHAKPGIRWEAGFEEALKKARAAGKPVLVDFWADWCGWCHRLDRTTYVDPAVVRLSEGFVAVKVNTEGAPKDVAIAERYDVSSLPTIAFLSPSGRQVLRLSGFQGPGQFPRTLESARQAALKVMGWEATLARNASHAEALAGLGVHLFEQEFYEESRGLLYQAIKVDCDRPVDERKRTRLLLAIVQNYDRKYPEAETLLKDGLAQRPPDEYDSKLLYVLGRTYLASGRRNDARDTMRKLLAKHPDTSMAEKARETLKALEDSR
jgi:thioredoxin-like negative regulator of GroEL